MKINAILSGKIAPLSQDCPVLSAIDKKPIDGPVEVSFMGIVCDEQADKIYHGGSERALHHYNFDHYAFFQEVIGQRRVLENPGAFGENISTIGLSEEDVSVGDIFRLGTTLLEVSQPRAPCGKLNYRLGHQGVSKMLQDTGKTGWHYRVIEPGFISASDSLLLVERPFEEWTLKRLNHYFYTDPLNYAALEEIAQLKSLSPYWHHVVAKRIKTKTLEDWEGRLMGV